MKIKGNYIKFQCFEASHLAYELDEECYRSATSTKVCRLVDCLYRNRLSDSIVWSICHRMM